MTAIGKTAHGTVIRVLPYGALVRLDDGDVGLIHISELDESYVHHVRDFVSEGTRVAVKVLAEKSGGRFEFSIKQLPQEEREISVPEFESVAPASSDNSDEQEFDEDVEADLDEHLNSSYRHEAVTPFVSGGARAAFDAKLRDFLCDSSERLGDLRRHNETRARRR